MKKEMIIGLILVLFLSGCQIVERNTPSNEKSEGKQEVLRVVVVGPIVLMKETTDFLKGIEMAVSELNEDKSFGYQIAIDVVDDKSSIIEATLQAQQLEHNENVVAVIGHWNTHVSIPVSELYNQQGLLHINPIVSSNVLSECGYKNFLRTIPNNQSIVEALVSEAQLMASNRIAIYYEQTSYGVELANLFEKIAEEKGLEIIDRVSDVDNPVGLNRMVDKWQALDCNGVFLASGMRYAQNSIKEIRKRDEWIPIYGSDALDLEGFVDELGASANGVTMVTYDHPSTHQETLMAFKQNYKQLFGKRPDMWAIQAYDAVHYIGNGIKASGSTKASDISAVLKDGDWQMTMGNVSFSHNGEPIGIPIYIKTVKDGRFIYRNER